MDTFRCSHDTSLSKEEKALFSGYLQRHGLSDNIWDLFEEWVSRSTPEVGFFYLKVHDGADLVGLGLFLRIKPFDLRTSYAKLRGSGFPSKLGGAISALTNNCVYLSFRNLITSNLSRPFFCRDTEMEQEVLGAMLRSLRGQSDADMVSIVDTALHDDLYRQEGFTKYPSSSEAYLDVTKYTDISQYLGEHRSLKKNLARRKKRVQTEIEAGPVSKVDRQEMMACVECSAGLSRVNNPCQQFFEDNIWDTDVFNSDKYLHIRVRVDGRIAGFHIFQVCGSRMGGVLGGFNRDYTRNNFVYERVIVASLDYAIQEHLERVQYSLVDNQTKLRLVESREPCGLYFYSSSRLNRKVFDLTYKFGDVYDLFLLESKG
ncbi:MAG: hypothetical protein HN348_17865 [Proteobacteria bacterium]|nr:hypothetical protein [Pseudomonadota bacterium]